MAREYIFKKIVMANLIQTFYDDVFQYHYCRLKEKDQQPQVLPIALISFLQMSNLLLVVIIVINLLFKDMWKNISYILVALYFVILTCNFFIYQVMGRKNIILNRNKSLSINFGKIIGIYFIFSISLPLILIYFINEVW